MGDPAQLNKPLKFALQYAAAGFRVFPCKPGMKVPATRNGCLDGTTDEAAIRRMFFNPRFNIGLSCGPQPNGINLLAIDVDLYKTGGVDCFEALHVDEQMLYVPSARHSTPSGGYHVFYDAPPGFRNTREQLAPGIDTRGDGGYVVVPPSRFGEPEKPYNATEETWLLRRKVEDLPLWLFAGADGPAVESPVDVPDLPQRNGRRVLSEAPDLLPVDESPGDYVRRLGDWTVELERFGWVHVRGNYWVRPGKNPRDGHSAVLHDDGPLVVFTTDVPRELERVGHRTVDGTGFAVSLFELIAAYEHGGDLAEAGRAIRASMPKRSRPQASESGTARTDDPKTAEEAATSTIAGLNLPVEFWEARPILEHIRDAAHASLTSPDALLINALARTATLVHPSIKLPPVVGSTATFDFMGCVVAETSGGKSIASNVAKDLLPDPQRTLHDEERTIMFDRPVGSGEGIPQAFMVPEFKEDEDGKRKATGRQIVGKQALHLVVDESTGLVAQAQRKGTTIIQTLLSAWSGQTLGQQNASAETRRIVDGGRCRVAAALNIQSSNAYMLFTEEMSTLGLTSRVLFASAHDPDAPDDDVDWPGKISFPIPPGFQTGEHWVEYDPAIRAAIRAERREVLRNGVADKSTGHTSLLRCKVAAILAIWEGRLNVTLDDWSLAGTVCETSAAVLSHLRDLRSSQVRDQRHTAAEVRGETEAVVEDAKDRRAVATLSAKLVTKVDTEGMGRNQLRKATTSASTKHRFDAALALAVSNGYLIEVDGRVQRA